MSRCNLRCSAGFQSALSREDGGAGNPEPELDLPCTEGRPDDKKEDRISQARPTYDSIAEERPAANTLR
jgi:hypothetical protein